MDLLERDRYEHKIGCLYVAAAILMTATMILDIWKWGRFTGDWPLGLPNFVFIWSFNFLLYIGLAWMRGYWPWQIWALFFGWTVMVPGNNRKSVVLEYTKMAVKWPYAVSKDWDKVRFLSRADAARFRLCF